MHLLILIQGDIDSFARQLILDGIAEVLQPTSTLIILVHTLEQASVVHNMLANGSHPLTLQVDLVFGLKAVKIDAEAVKPKVHFQFHLELQLLTNVHSTLMCMLLCTRKHKPYMCTMLLQTHNQKPYDKVASSQLSLTTLPCMQWIRKSLCIVIKYQLRCT